MESSASDGFEMEGSETLGVPGLFSTSTVIKRLSLIRGREAAISTNYPPSTAEVQMCVMRSSTSAMRSVDKSTGTVAKRPSFKEELNRG